MPERPLPTEAQVRASIRDRRNWGRWGQDDQRGAINLITPAKRVAAARLVRSGRSVSLSRPFPKEPAPNIGALCHTWDEDGMWNGRDPRKEVTFDGATFGGIEHWAGGIMTRGVMLDVPRHRGVSCVTHDSPVHGWELEDIVARRGIRLEPGDALCVYCGREQWQAEHPTASYGRAVAPALQERPGLHASCLPFLRDHDVSVLVWDMIDHSPIGYEVSWAVHSAIFAYGVALVDNALLEPLARACIDEGRDEFQLTVAPLVVAGGTGSPVNPIAVF